MVARRQTGLSERLAPHVPRRFDPDVYAWWPRRTPRWALTPRRAVRRPASDRPVLTQGRRRRSELAQVLERLATLLGVGHDLPAAVAHVVGTGRGPVVAELAAVAARLAAGAPAAAAVRSWARRAACPHVAQLAADLRDCADVGDATTAFAWHAHMVRRAVLRDQRQTMRRRTVVVSVVAVVTWVTTVALVVA